MFLSTDSNENLRERRGVLRFSVEFQLVLPVKSFLTEGAGEGFLSSVNEDVPCQMIGLLKCPATLPAAVFSLNPVGVQLHHGNVLDGKQAARVWLEHNCVEGLVGFRIFQFVRPELHVGPLERLRFNGISVDMICIERNQEVLLLCEVLGQLLVEVHVDPENFGCLTDVLRQKLVAVLGRRPQTARV